MASFCPLLLPLFITYTASSFALASYPNSLLIISSISASPEFQPTPSSSPTPSPDISPLFPSPGAAVPPSDQSSLPTIPSSPSPPNPDVFDTAPAPEVALPPSQFLPVSGTRTVFSTGSQLVLVVLLAVSAAEIFGWWW